MMKLWIRHVSGTHKGTNENTHTHGHAIPPFYGGGGGGGGGGGIKMIII